MVHTDAAVERAARPWIALAVVVLPLAAALVLGADSNWDLRNYHLYNPHALLAGRTGDIAAAQLQGWHNPLIDVPMYLLAMAGAPAKAISAWLALPMMLSLACLLRLQRLCTGGVPPLASRLALVVLAISGAAAWSTFAQSMNDGIVAAGMLAALCLALESNSARSWAVAGLVAGAVAGLKLSSGFYCLTLAGVALVGGSARERLGRVAALALGGIVGVALTYGFWGWHLYRSTGNPAFPYFNDIFRSPDALPISYVDGRFHPRSMVDALSAPVRLLRTTQAFSELKLRDPRLLLGLLASGWLAWRSRLAPAGDAVARRLRALALFLSLGTVLWLAQSGIYRYAIVLEMLGALAFMLALQRVPRARGVVLVVAVLVVSADTRRPDWGRDAGGASIASLRAPALGAGAMVVTATGDPLAYLALGLPKDVPLLGLDNNLVHPDTCDALQARVSARLLAQRGPLWLLEDPGQPASPPRELLRTAYGLAPSGACRDYPNPLGPARLCPLARSGPPRAPACALQRRKT